MKKDCMTMSGTAVCQNSIFSTLALSRLRISSLRMTVTIASFFSSILEEKVSPVQALCLINPNRSLGFLSVVWQREILYFFPNSKKGLPCF